MKENRESSVFNLHVIPSDVVVCDMIQSKSISLFSLMFSN